MSIHCLSRQHVMVTDVPLLVVTGLTATITYVMSAATTSVKGAAVRTKMNTLNYCKCGN